MLQVEGSVVAERATLRSEEWSRGTRAGTVAGHNCTWLGMVVAAAAAVVVVDASVEVGVAAVVGAGLRLVVVDFAGLGASASVLSDSSSEGSPSSSTVAAVIETASIQACPYTAVQTRVRADQTVDPGVGPCSVSVAVVVAAAAAAAAAVAVAEAAK